jgi:hypothetical protein
MVEVLGEHTVRVGDGVCAIEINFDLVRIGQHIPNFLGIGLNINTCENN